MKPFRDRLRTANVVVLVLVVLFTISSCVVEYCFHYNTSPRGVDPPTYSVMICRGAIQLRWTMHVGLRTGVMFIPAHYYPMEFPDQPDHPKDSPNDMDWRLPGFQYLEDWNRGSLNKAPAREVCSITVPYWFLLVPWVIYACFPLREQIRLDIQRQGVRAGLCPYCKYDMSGTPYNGCCPECGKRRPADL